MDVWITGIVIALFIGYVIYLIITKQWEKLKKTAYILMLQAERVYDNNEGEKKFEEVFDYLYYGYIPRWLQLLVSKEYIIFKLQEWYNDAKEYLGSCK